MPPMFFGPPWEFLVIELVYFLVVTGICLFIYFKTREVYNLSQYRGLFHFRNIFLYFALAYVFRLIQVSFMLSREALDFGVRGGFFPFVLPVVYYFSTMTILSLAMAVFTRSSETIVKTKDYFLHAIALVSSFAVLFSRAGGILVLIQAVVLLGAVLAGLFLSKEKKQRPVFSHNKITFLLLAVFWIVSLLGLSRGHLFLEAKVVLYFLSSALFVSIFLRVKKRLPSDAKKKEQA